MILRVALAWLSELPCLSDGRSQPGFMSSYDPRIMPPAPGLLLTSWYSESE